MLNIFQICECYWNLWFLNLWNFPNPDFSKFVNIFKFVFFPSVWPFLIFANFTFFIFLFFSHFLFILLFYVNFHEPFLLSISWTFFKIVSNFQIHKRFAICQHFLEFINISKIWKYFFNAWTFFKIHEHFLVWVSFFKFMNSLKVHDLFSNPWTFFRPLLYLERQQCFKPYSARSATVPRLATLHVLSIMRDLRACTNGTYGPVQLCSSNCHPQCYQWASPP